MKKQPLTLLFLLPLLGSAAWAGPNKYSPEEEGVNYQKWSACEASSDCTTIQGACGPITINKQFSSDAEPYYHTLGTMVSCEGVSDKRRPDPVCEKGHCVYERVGLIPQETVAS